MSTDRNNQFGFHVPIMFTCGANVESADRSDRSHHSHHFGYVSAEEGGVRGVVMGGGG